MARLKNETRWSEELGQYVDGICVDGVFYEKSSYTRIVEPVDETHYTASYVSTDGGEVIYSVRRSTRGRNKSKCWLDNNTSNVAKDKMLRRVSVRQDGDDIVGYFRKHSDYIQVSAGLNHAVRDDIVVDIDSFPAPDGGECAVGVMADAVLERLSVMSELGIPMPSMFQIHKTNGHVQLHYILDRSVRVYNIYVDRYTGLLIDRKTADWNRYRDLLRFFAFLLGGDQHYTGWQIKNPYVTDPVFSGEFVTYWNTGGGFEPDTRDADVAVYGFGSLYSYVDKYVGKGVADNYGKFLQVLLDKGVVRCEDEFLLKAYDTFMCFSRRNAFASGKCSGMTSSIAKDVSAMEMSERAHRERSYLESLSRNGFVREYTISLVRKSRNTIGRDVCRVEVLGALRDIIGDTGYMVGTVNRGVYSDDEFDRDFNGAYDYATANYDSSICQWTDEDRARSIEYRRMRKFSKMVGLALMIQDNPSLADDTNANNRLAAKLLDLKSPRTVSSYRRELGICGTGNFGLPSSALEWFSGIGEYREFCEMMEAMADKVLSDGGRGSESWRRRLSELAYDRDATDRICALINTGKGRS